MKLFLLFSILLIGATSGQDGIDANFCWFNPCPDGFRCRSVGFIPRCVPIPTTTTTTTTTPSPVSLTCDNFFCWFRSTCAMVYPNWCPSGPGCQPQPQCVTYNPCLFQQCSWRQECVLVQQQWCWSTSCTPTAECRRKRIIWPWPSPWPSPWPWPRPWPWGHGHEHEEREGHKIEGPPSCKDANCTKPTECALVKPMSCGTEKDCPLHPACIEENACAKTKCKNGTECVLHQVECVKAPCNPVAECDPIRKEPKVEPEGSGKPAEGSGKPVEGSGKPVEGSGKPVEEECKKNEYFEKCKTNCCDIKCNEKKPEKCSEKCNGSGCVCKKGFFRDASGNCCTQKECDNEKGGKP